MPSDVKGILLSNRVVVPENYGTLVERGYGEKKEEGLTLSLYEACYLVEKGKLRVYKDGKELSLEELLAHAEQAIENFYIKYAVFKDIRERGYVIKTGFKFGTHFRVYPRGKKPGEAHTRYVIHVWPEERNIELHEIARMVRLARAIRTELILALVDNENEIVYYKVERVGL